MDNAPIRDKVSARSLFGVFLVDLQGPVGELVGRWHRTLTEAEQHLERVMCHQGEHYIALSNTDHERQIKQQETAGLVFKTGHDLLMDEFDEWLKQNDLVRGAAMAAKLGLSDKEFKSLVKKKIVKLQSMPDHDNLVGYPAD